MSGQKEGSLEAPTRHPLDWGSDVFYSEESLNDELERVFDICHGCRRCFNLCNAFPTLFDAVDESDTGELDGVPREVYWDVVDHCYLCDMCYMSKCPYVPPHEWNVDFPQLMLRAKATRFRRDGATMRDKVLASTDAVGRLAGIPVVSEVVNAPIAAAWVVRCWNERWALTARLRCRPIIDTLREPPLAATIRMPRPPPSRGTRGRVVLFTTCYGNRNAPDICTALADVYRHNGIGVTLAGSEQCCGMPKLELGDLESAREAMEANIPELLTWVEHGWDIVAPVPSCVLMFKQQLPLMFPDDERVRKVAAAMFDPFDYLWRRHKSGALKTDFAKTLGKVAYQVPCHQRVQNIGPRTKSVLELIPDTEVETIERCSGHDGTYGGQDRVSGGITENRAAGCSSRQAKRGCALYQ